MKTNFDKRNPKKFLGYLMASALVFFAGSVSATNHVVTIDSQTNSFAPSALTIDVGDTVTWVNDSGFHNVNGNLSTFPNNADGSIDNGAASSSWVDYVWVCATAGSYDYQCDPHASLGMVGTIAANAPPVACLLDEVTLTMTDSWGDTWNGGTLTIDGVTYDQPTTASGGASDTYTLCVDLSTCIDVTYLAGSYSSENSWSISDASGAVLASGGDNSGQIGVCAISGCTDSTATNYNALATIDDGSCIAPCTDNAVVMTLTSFAYQDGAYGMVYTITDASGLTVATGSGTAGAWASDDTDLCLPTGCYDLAVSSAYCCNTSYGWAFMGLSGDAGTGSANISIGGATCAILGCIDSTATNYNALATVDDGSCAYPCLLDEVTLTMTDSYGDTWNGGTLTIDGVTYDQPTTASGGASDTYTLCVDLSTCIDVIYSAGSYSSENSWSVSDASGAILASAGNVSGTFGSSCPVPGCTDSTATNYNALATIDDGSCYISGCLDSLATNYNALATLDDGSCAYACIVLAPTNEDFSLGALPIGTCVPNQWASSYTSGDGWRFLGNPGYAAGTNGRTVGTYAWIDFSGTDAGAILRVENVDVSSLTAPTLAFDYFSDFGTYNSLGTIPSNICYVEAFDGSVWNAIATLQLDTVGWNTYVYSLAGYSYGSSVVSVRFRAESGGSTSDYYNDLLVDDVRVMEAPAYGCTDMFASNYNASANMDDGSCLYPGCQDPLANNYCATCNVDDFSCTYNTCSTLDFIDNFESASLTGTWTTTSASNSAVSIITGANAITDTVSIEFTGGATASYGYPTTDTAAFANLDHIATATTCLDLSNAASQVNLSFSASYSTYYTNNFAWMRVLINGSPIKDNNNVFAYNNTNNLGTTGFSGDAGIAATYLYDLSAYAGQSQVYVTFETSCRGSLLLTGLYGDMIRLDDVNVYNVYPCTYFAASSSLINDVTCNLGADGSAVATATNTFPVSLSYLWSDGQTTATATGLAAGSYSCVVTDSINGCSDSTFVTISEPAAIVISAVVLDATSPLVADGSASISVVGGTPCITLTTGYCAGGPTSAFDSELQSVTLNGDAGSSINYATNCAAVVTGLNNQSATMSSSLTSGGTYTVNVDPGTCGGTYGGFAEVWIDYNLDGVFDVTTEFIGRVSAHVVGGSDITFTVPVGAASGTTRMRVMHNETSSTLAFDPCASFLWGSMVDFGIELNGGTDAYTYAWSNGDTTATASGLALGPIGCTITDCNGCTAVYSGFVGVNVITGCMDATMWNYNPIANTSDSLSCIPMAYGCLDIAAANAVAFDTLTANTDDTTLCCYVSGCTDIYASNYDASACFDDGSCVTPACWSSFPYTEDFSTGTAAMSLVGIGVSSGSSIDSTNNGDFAWHGQGGTSTGWLSPYSTGDQAFATNPSHIASARICVDLTSYAAGTGIQMSFDLYQEFTFNSTYNWFRVQAGGVVLSNVNGVDYISTIATLGESTSESYDLSAFAGQSIFIELQNCGKYSDDYYSGKGDQSYVDNINISSVAFGCTDTLACNYDASAGADDGSCYILSASASAIDALCNGASDGSVSVSSNDSTATYSWDNGSTGSTVSGLAAGTYVVTATNSYGCVSTDTVTLGEPTLLSLTTSVVDESGTANADGSINLTVSGGTPCITLTTGYCAGGPTSTADSELRDVTLNGDAGSSINYVSAAGTIGLNNQTALSASLTSGSSYTVNVNPGTIGGTYGGNCEVWIDYNLDGVYDATESLGNVPAHVVGGTDITFTVPAGLGAGNTRMRVMHQEGGSALGLNSCASFAWGSMVDFDILLNGGSNPFTYAWSNGDTTQDVSNLTSGSYSVTVTDCNGCTSSASATIVVAAVAGCTDATAWNYNASANVSDSSCIAFAYACLDTVAANYTAFDTLTANTGDTTLCCYVTGCTDPFALNYNALACYDDGSCALQVCNTVPFIETWEDTTFHNWNVSPNGSLPTTPLSLSSTALTADSNYVINDNISLQFTGGETSLGWGAYSTEAAAFANTSHVQSATVCIDMSAVTGSASLDFNYITESGFTNTVPGLVGTAYSTFRVKINGIVAQDVNGTQWHGDQVLTNLVYDLSAYAGQSVYVTFEAACKYSAGYNVLYADNVIIDNINFAAVTFGCTDVNATNYNPAASADDGSCVYPCYVAPWSSSFEDGVASLAITPADWTQNSDDGGNWTRDAFGTGSSGTGPSAAYDGDFYMYTESSGVYNTAMVMTSHCMDISAVGSPKFSMMVNMLGAAMGTLQLDLSGDGGTTWDSTWSVSGDQGAAWFEVTADLSVYSATGVTARITGTTGTSYTSDMAVDYTRVYDGSVVPGCTDSTATNYNALATIDDGSCIAPCTDNTVNMILTSPQWCDGSYGMVYTITDASGVTVATGSGAAGSWCADSTEICLPTGCYDVAVSSANCCDYGYGWAFLGESGQAGTGANNISVGGVTCAISGCTDSTATNYNALATVDDGSCTYPCLLDEVTLTMTDSYGDTWNGGTLTIDGVTYDQPTVVSGGASDTYTLCVDLSTCIDVTYSAGSFSSENSWSISDASGAVLASGGPVSGQIGVCAISGCTDSTATNYNALATIDDGSCAYPPVACLLDEVTLTMTDSWGDTWNGGTLTIDGVTYDQPTTASGGASDTYTLCVDLSTCIDVTYSAGSYSTENSWSISDASGAVLASGGDNSGQIGVCAISGCTDSTATNYDALATIDDGSCAYPCLLDEVTLTMTDTYGDTWDGAYLTIDGQNYEPASGNSTESFTLCVDLSTCVDIVYTAGSYPNEHAYTITDASGTTLATGTQGAQDASIGNCIVLVDGCTDSTALNYDPLANNDDGSCVFCVYGCTDSTATNYDALATCDDASCIAPVYGCTDATALNYYPGANIDDGNCCFVSGCTDDLYTEYDALACIDDGSCATLVNPGSCNFDSPTGAYTSALIHDRVTITWDNMNDANCMIDQYRIRYREVGTSAWSTKTMSGSGLCIFGLNTTSKTLLGLTASTTYEYYMKAWYCAGSTSSWSTLQNFTTLDICLNVDNFAASTPTTTKATFTWTLPATAYSFARIKLRVDTVGSTWTTAGGFGVFYPDVTKNKNSLNPGTTYRASVRTWCDANGGPYRSAAWSTPIFWTQPTSIRVEGGTAINNLEIYPNPSRDIFNVTFTSEDAQDLEVRVINVVGEVVYTENLEQFVGEYTKQVDLATFTKGVYFLEITTNNGVVNKKLILQ